VKKARKDVKKKHRRELFVALSLFLRAPARMGGGGREKGERVGGKYG